MSVFFAYWHTARLRFFRIDRSIFAGSAALFCALALTLLAAGLVYSSINRMHAAFNLVQHTDQVILQIANIEKALLSADSSVRAQAYAGGRPNRTDARITNDAIEADVNRLTALVADNPEQTARIRRLQAIIAKRGEVPINREGVEFRQMATIRAEIEDMQTAEWRLLQSRTQNKERATVIALILAVVTFVFALVLGALGVYLLTTERMKRRHIEMELMRIQRLNMMSLTTMALAHEINQPLAAASNYLGAAIHLAKAPDANVPIKIVNAAMHAQEQVIRAGKIIKRLRGFIAKSEDERTIERPAIIIDDAISLIGTIDGSIKVETEIEENLPCVSVDRIQLQQVLINLIRNSIEAVDGNKRGILNLSVIALDSTHVRFSVADNGPGLSKKVQETLFKPLESTKAGGMGVGLMICKAIIVAHGGEISASSALEGGTIISFTLPAAAPQLAA